MRYPREWVLFHRRNGVRYHGPVMAALYAQAKADGTDTAELVGYYVPDPSTVYVLSVGVSGVAA